MKKFLKENKVFWVIIIGALIAGGVIYFDAQKNSEREASDTKKATTKCLAPSKAMVTKVIDGDTVIVEGGSHIRLLGIDADEKGYSCYESAKKQLEQLVLAKEVELEKDVTDVDQYGRCLRYIFVNGRSINLELIKQGEAVCRFYTPDTKYRKECASLEKEAIEKKIGCKWGQKKVKEVDKEKNIEFQWEKLTPQLTGLKVVGACQTGNYLEKEVIVEGKIADTYRSKTNTVFLNLEKPYPNQCFSAVIFSSDQYKFIEYPERYYTNKTVRVMGEVKQYRGRPEIILKDPSQIEVGK